MIAAIITRGLNVVNPYFIATAGLLPGAAPVGGTLRLRTLLGVGL